MSVTASSETAAARPGVPPAPERLPLPPGPRLPRIIQTAGFMVGGARFLEWARHRYGGAVYMRTLFDDGFVMLFDPELVKELFQGPHEQLNAGEANALLGPILGERSVLLLDGREHLRHRRLMLPPFHGRRMQAYEEAMRDAADAEIDSWPVGRPFELLPSLQSLTLGVIMRAVFGFEPGPAEDELRRRLRAMIAPVAQPRGLVLMFTFGRLGRRTDTVQRFEASKRAVDEILYAEITRRRQADDLAERDDVFSALLLAEDEHGERLTDREVRDELVTLLIAGHETTATGLAWTFDLLLHTPDVLERCDPGDTQYLDAVVKESLRLRPVIPGVGRVVRGEPFRVGTYEVPIGMEINPSIRIIHRRGDLYPRPAAFQPERFLGDDAPDTYTWLPFGGGTRRCLGASFALMEMRTVLARVLERTALRPASRQPEKVQFRGITLAPKGAVRAIQEHAPRPAPRPAQRRAPPPAPAAPSADAPGV